MSNPKTYVHRAATYDPRRCIVCRSSFQPRRWDQVYCSGVESYTCGNNLWNAERMMLGAGLSLAYKCSDCGLTPTKATPVVITITNPCTVSNDTDLATYNLTLMCKPCRHAMHLRLTLTTFTSDLAAVDNEADVA